MGFLKKLLGGDKKSSSAPRRSSAMAEVAASKNDGTADGDANPSDDGAASTKQLIRMLGLSNPEKRESAARELAASKSRAGMRPLMNAYLNYGDPAVLDALAGYGSLVAAPAIREAFDLSVLGVRRARLMDILGICGDEEGLRAAREGADADARGDEAGLEIHMRACLAMARLGDLFGVDRLAEDLRMNDEDRRMMAMHALMELDSDRAKHFLAEHVNRYISEATAVPIAIEVNAPLLVDPNRKMTNYVCDHIKASPHNLTVLIGSGGIRISQNKRPQLMKSLEGWGSFHYSLQVMPPEEQIAALQEARAAAVAGPGARAVFGGALPGPGDNPPLPHFLTQEPGVDYNAKILIVEPHEYLLLQEWWHYVQDLAAVPTDVEVILGISLEQSSSLTDEERMIYQLANEEERSRFARAYLAHI
jgi:hypothetical protein